MNIRSRLIAVAVAAAFAPVPALATNGYFATGWGVAVQGMAGAGVAVPTDSLAVAQNPALMFFVGNRFDLEIDFFNPSPRGYTANPDAAPPPNPSVPPGTVESQNDWFFLPAAGWNMMLDANSSFGISLGGNGGLNTEYDTATFQFFAPPPNFVQGGVNVNPGGVLTATKPTGVDLAQLMVGFTYARKIGENQSIGITPILAMQRFKATGLEPFRAASVSPQNVTNNGYDYSYGGGFQVGWYGRVLPNLDFGMSYRSPMWMSKFDKYQGLFAEGGDFDIPATIALGLAYRPAPNVLIAFDWQQILYNDVRAVGNPNNIDIASCFSPVKQEFCLGAQNGIGFGWDSMSIFKLGAQWDINPQWTVRGGFSYNSQFADNTQGLFNILAPAVIRMHGSLGATFRMSQRDEINFAYTHAFKEELDGTSPSLTGPQSGQLFMEQNSIAVSWGHKF
jgi:long-chain fatty acid transport protein